MKQLENKNVCRKDAKDGAALKALNKALRRLQKDIIDQI
jgi:hypothetical protein